MDSPWEAGATLYWPSHPGFVIGLGICLVWDELIEPLDTL